MKYEQIIEHRLKQALTVKERMVRSASLIGAIEEAVELILKSYREEGGRLFLAGNGGSAADAQHLACELVGRFYLDRRSLSAEALTVNSSSLTAISNDFGYENLFARALEGKGKRGDVFLGLSTSGSSPNILMALRKAKEMGIHTIGLTGESGGDMAELCDVLIPIPETDTPRIQEGHILAGHIICEIVEKEMFPHG
ncbi:MAG: D-sedoheptulose 7-phosphate isomerase [Spirochaetales bacterium]|nr:D-sedoheptulose 7-phosphate isomerase [Spirochaetales bacterium]